MAAMADYATLNPPYGLRFLPFVIVCHLGTQANKQATRGVGTLPIKQAQRGGVLKTLGGLAEQVVDLTLRQQAAIAHRAEQGYGDGECRRCRVRILGLGRPAQSECPKFPSDIGYRHSLFGAHESNP